MATDALVQACGMLIPSSDLSFSLPCASDYSEPIKYNLKVAGSIAKQVYVAEGLAPPTSVSTISSAYRTIWSRVTDASYWAQLLTKGEWKRVGIYAVEAYGIFTIGEMVRRILNLSCLLCLSAPGALTFSFPFYLSHTDRKEEPCWIQARHLQARSPRPPLGYSYIYAPIPSSCSGMNDNDTLSISGSRR